MRGNKPRNGVAQCAFHALHVIDVILQFNMRIARGIHSPHGVVAGVQKEPGHVEMIDRLNHQSQSGVVDFAPGKAQICNQCFKSAAR